MHVNILYVGDLLADQHSWCYVFFFARSLIVCRNKSKFLSTLWVACCEVGDTPIPTQHPGRWGIPNCMVCNCPNHHFFLCLRVGWSWVFYFSPRIWSNFHPHLLEDADGTGPFWPLVGWSLPFVGLAEMRLINHQQVSIQLSIHTRELDSVEIM